MEEETTQAAAPLDVKELPVPTALASMDDIDARTRTEQATGTGATTSSDSGSSAPVHSGSAVREVTDLSGEPDDSGLAVEPGVGGHDSFGRGD